MSQTLRDIKVRVWFFSLSAHCFQKERVLRRWCIKERLGGGEGGRSGRRQLLTTSEWENEKELSAKDT